jgi:biotin carboxylase
MTSPSSDQVSALTARPPSDEGLAPSQAQPRVLLLMSPATYRAGAFLEAANRLGIEAIQGVDLPPELAPENSRVLAFDLGAPATGEQIAAVAGERAIDAVLAIDDSATLVAARANAALGRPHNDPESALAARDKWIMREAFRRGGVPVPHYEHFPITGDPEQIAMRVPYPCVVKPLRLSGSRGVIRADDPRSFVAAWNRTKRLLLDEEAADPHTTSILVESFIPGFEIALEGLLIDGRLEVLAIFDKPDPLDGPFFEETIYVTPSRLPAATQELIATRTAQAAAAVGLRTGPVHAELRVNDEDVWPIELAGRSIGGLCSSVLEFGAGMSLEELILRQAVGYPIESTTRNGGAAGVMMIPIPKRGMLRAVDGIEQALTVPGVTGIEITARFNYPIVPLPEGASYLGFIFARGDTPAAVEAAIRDAHARLTIRIDPMLGVQPVG